MRFTPHQERALDLDRHLAVTANAGSGKTQVLVERYVRLLMRGVPVGEVVALTYTDKAASALRRKIADRVSGALLATEDRAEAARLESIRDALPSAFIGTIHAFCARVLREYPVEAGVDAAFGMLEKVDGESMLRECMTGILGEVLGDGDPEIPSGRFMDLLRSLGRRRVLHLLGRLVAKPDLLETFTGPGGIYTQSDETILALWETTIRESIEGDLISPRLLSDLEEIAGASNSKRRGEALGALALVRTEGDLALRAGAFASLAAMMFTKSGGIQKRFLGESEEDGRLVRSAERIAEKRRLLDPLIDSVLTGSLTPLHRALLADTRILLSLALAVLGKYSRAKEEDARLDFDDLQLKMRLLLSNGTVRAELAGRFRFVMVDEYQDTNTLQLGILLPLLQDLSSGNLIIVGDPKQSIYRFRDADVEVFERSRGAIANAAGVASLISLGESFRPLRDIVAFVNLLFRGLMGTVEGIPYDPLVRARMNDDPGNVEVLLPLPPGEGGCPQEELVARRILDLAGGGSVVYTREEHPRPLAFRDIALLLRSRNALEEFEQAFIRNGVPYVVSGGVGYFQTQDVYDMYNYLRFLLNRSDDVALAGILRAPFFNVSDAALFDLARSRGGKTLWEALAERAARGVPSLAHAAEVIGGDLVLGARLPAAELIARIIRRTGFTAALAGTVRGGQAEANLGKLLQMARSYESQGFTSLYDFVARLERLIEEEEKEGQAAIESQTDAARIMTIHAAKGLEFPVVIVPDLQRQFQFDDEPFLDASLGIGLLTRGESVSAPLSEYLKAQARRKAVEEEQRIFYVACTRARDRLLLSADAGTEGRGDTWLGWLRRCCEDRGQPLGPDPLRFDVVTSRYDGSVTTDEAHTLIVPVIQMLPVRPGSAATPAQERAGGRIDIAPVPSRSKGEIFSASRIRTYDECPAKYFFRYVLGVPSGAGPFVPGTGEEFSDGDYPAELRGRVFHSAMENADDLQGGGLSVDTVVRAALVREAPFTAAGYPSLIEDVASLVRGVLDSRSWKDISSGSDVRTEFSISASLGEDFITGTIDRLYRTPDGLWTVLDYKTDSVSAADLVERAGAYWAQLDFYALMVRRLCNAPSVRIRLLFAHHPDVVLQNVLGPDDLRRREESVARIIARIKTGDFPPSHPPCHGCPAYPNQCIPA
ncbi:MAG TPA: UvrD-helicase domain-containing protein [Bacteroidota bacterium]